MAVPKEKFGIMAKPSTRMIITLAAINISPKLFVKDCTTIIAMEKMACVKPEGSPSLMISKECLLSGFKNFSFKSKISLILASLSTQRTADTACAIAVASATPATPI